MSEWAGLGKTLIEVMRDLFRWRRIRKVKEYENDPDVQDELRRRAAVRNAAGRAAGGLQGPDGDGKG